MQRAHKLGRVTIAGSLAQTSSVFGRDDMMLPEELAVLERNTTRFRRQLLFVAFIGLIAAALPSIAYLAVGDNLDDLSGETTAVNATVDDVTVIDSCGRQNDREEYRIEVSWNLDGTSGHDTYERCGNAPSEGDMKQVWVSPDGDMKTYPPWMGLIVCGVLGLMGCGIVWLVGGIGAYSRVRLKRRLLTMATGPLLPGIAVQVRWSPKSLWMRHHTPQFFGTRHAVSLTPILYSNNGVFVPGYRRAKLTGQWWCYPTQAAHGHRRIGLLVRGHERCWIEFIH